MRISLDEIGEEVAKTKDLVRVLCDTVYLCEKERKPLHHIKTLCPLVFEQCAKSLNILDDYMLQENGKV